MGSMDVGSTTFDSGPWLRAAMLVESVLEEKSGVLSYIRVIDQTTITAEGAEPPTELPEGGALPVKLAISLQSGEAKGSYALEIVPELPSGRRIEGQALSITLAPGRGVNVNADLVLPVEPGLYLIDVIFEGRRLTRVPLELIYRWVKR